MWTYIFLCISSRWLIFFISPPKLNAQIFCIAPIHSQNVCKMLVSFCMNLSDCSFMAHNTQLRPPALPWMSFSSPFLWLTSNLWRKWALYYLCAIHLLLLALVGHIANPPSSISFLSLPPSTEPPPTFKVCKLWVGDIDVGSSEIFWEILKVSLLPEYRIN